MPAVIDRNYWKHLLAEHQSAGDVIMIDRSKEVSILLPLDPL
jgi:hypothetical protein